MSGIGATVKGWIIAVCITAAAMYLLIAIGTRSSRIPTTGMGVASVSPGSDGRLNNGSPSVPVSLDENLVPQVAKSTNLSAVSDRLFFVVSDTPVRVSESSLSAVRVRILGGSAKGRLGWVPPEWVKPR